MPQIMDDVTVDGTTTANRFIGPLTGTATRATADASGNTIATTYATKTEVAGKQDALVSGTNIKTVNGTSLLGSGDITIGGLSGTVGTDTKPIKVVNGQAVEVTNDLQDKYVPYARCRQGTLYSGVYGVVSYTRIQKGYGFLSINFFVPTDSTMPYHGLTLTTINSILGITLQTLWNETSQEYTGWWEWYPTGLSPVDRMGYGTYAYINGEGQVRIGRKYGPTNHSAWGDWDYKHCPGIIQIHNLLVKEG